MRFAEELGNERRLLAVDLPGHGRSAGRMPVSVEEAAVAVAGAVAADRPVHWLGYSMGGRVALQLACDKPDRVASLTLVSATAGIVDTAAREARRQADEALAVSLMADGLPAFVERWMDQPLFQSQRRLPMAMQAAMRNQRLRNSSEGLAAALRSMGTGAMEPLWDRLAAVKAPVLLVTGGFDEKFGKLAEEMSAELPRARHVIVPRAGHAVHTEDPVSLATAVGTFLRELEGTAAASLGSTGAM